MGKLLKGQEHPGHRSMPAQSRGFDKKKGKGAVSGRNSLDEGAPAGEKEPGSGQELGRAGALIKGLGRASARRTS
jgi:hypothetical protein